MNAPSTFRAGDSVSWTESLPNYPATDGWVLKFRLLRTTGAAVLFTASGSGSDYSVSLTSATTAPWAAGAGTLVSWVEKVSGERQTLESQAVTIAPDLTASANFDGRTPAAIALTDAKAALAAYASKGQVHVAEYDIGGRRMKFRTADEIIKLIAYYETQVARERSMQALLEGGSPRVSVRF